MSAQSMNLSKSLPVFASAYEAAVAAPGSYSLVIVRGVVPDGGLSEVSIDSELQPLCDASGQPVQFPSITAALRASEGNLSLAGFTGKAPAPVANQPIKCENGHWGVWMFGGTVNAAGQIIASPGSVLCFQGIVPVRRANVQPAASVSNPAEFAAQSAAAASSQVVASGPAPKSNAPIGFGKAAAPIIAPVLVHTKVAGEELRQRNEEIAAQEVFAEDSPLESGEPTDEALALIEAEQAGLRAEAAAKFAAERIARNKVAADKRSARANKSA